MDGSYDQSENEFENKPKSVSRLYSYATCKASPYSPSSIFLSYVFKMILMALESRANQSLEMAFEKWALNIVDSVSSVPIEITNILE